MVLLLDAVADLFDEICINLAGLKREYHIIRHGVILEHRIRNPVLNKFLVKHGGLHTYVLAIEILNGLVLRRGSGKR